MERKKTSIIYNLSPEELQYLLDTSNSYGQILEKIGLNRKGGNPETLKRIISEYNLSEKQLNANRSKIFYECGVNTHKKIDIPLEDILNGKYPKYQSSRLLKRLIDEGYKDKKCECCGLSEWQMIPIPLQLHHKDGNHNNNSLDNLEIRCPNCHAITENYRGKKRSEIKKIERNINNIRKRKEKLEKSIEELPVTRDELKRRIRNLSFISIGKEFNVSDNAIRKWCDKLNLPRTKKNINSFSDIEWMSI